MNQPPVEMHAAEVPSIVFLVVAAGFFAASLWWALSERGRTGAWTAALALVGGVIASLEEGWINTLIKLWYPYDAPAVVFTALGHPQPIYVHLVYPGFVGLGAYVTYRGLVSHPDGRLLARTAGAIVLMDLAFELPATSLGIFRYYGTQPFQLADGTLPLWVPFINAAGPVLGGVLIYLLEPLLSGRWRLLLALLPPLAYAGVYGGAGWPAYTGLNSEVSPLARSVLALVTVAMCIAVIAIARLALAGVTRSGSQLPRTSTAKGTV